jgi:HPt (histidine-containing phosphotransfer) domain-containing protein
MPDEKVYVDLNDSLKRVMGNTKLYVKLLGKFKDGTNLNTLEAALTAGDMEKAQSEAHTIKGVAGNLSFIELYKQSLELETQIKARSVNPGQLEAVKDAFSQTLLEVDKVIAQYG